MFTIHLTKTVNSRLHYEIQNIAAEMQHLLSVTFIHLKHTAVMEKVG